MLQRYDQLQQQTRELDALSVSRDLEYVRKLLRDEVTDQTRIRVLRIQLPEYVTIDTEDTQCFLRHVRFEIVKGDERIRCRCELERRAGDNMTYSVREDSEQ
jgi:hypothetical protein